MEKMLNDIESGFPCYKVHIPPKIKHGNVEEIFQEAIAQIPDERGILLFQYRNKFDEKIITELCTEFEELYDFSDSFFLKNFFLWKKKFSDY